MGLLHPDVGRPDHLAPFLCFIGDELAEVGGRLRKHGAAQFGEARFADLGATVLAGSPADFGKLIADETEKWAKVIKSAGIKPE